MVVLVGCERDTPDSIAPGMSFGVLGSDCAADRVGPLHRAGVELAQMDVRWDRLEPDPGRLDQSYADELATSIDTCRDAGIKVILGLGLQYAPDWVSKLPDGEYLDQAGNTHPGQLPNIVFSQDVRWAFERHAANVLELAPQESIHAVRLGTSEAGELGYPGGGQGDLISETGFWAFNDAAKTGNGLPPGVDRAPLAGWVPGDSTWQGQPVTDDQVATWFRWYTGAVVDAVVWQADMLRDLGFTGKLHVPLAGRGVLPADLRRAIASGLDGTADRDGSLERGLYYPDQLPALAQGIGTDDLLAGVTGLDDATAVQARSERPATDACSPMDHQVDLVSQPDVERWPASRWTIANARRAGLQVIGENPGSPRAPGTGGDPKSDNLRDQMQHAPRYAAECGLSAFLWAFEDDLFGDPRQMSLDEYREAISAYR
ncbi:beta-galactosidase [Kocuria sabuli]|uniref:beta-galactosidase n=1 Tax=Kocuria sabuli TaxID=3071448 RepID=UPI0034D70DA9